MYGGKLVVKGDTIFVFASENERGPGLIAPRGRHLHRGGREEARHRPADAASEHQGQAHRPGEAPARAEASSSPSPKWNDGTPETELNFKFYRQATNKIVGISDEAAAFLNGFFRPTRGGEGERRLHRSTTMSRIGWEQQTRRLPSAGLSSGSGRRRPRPTPDRSHSCDTHRSGTTTGPGRRTPRPVPKRSGRPTRSSVRRCHCARTTPADRCWRRPRADAELALPRRRHPESATRCR